ncbi:MAG: hypothetical protein ACRCUX_00870 [Beijerinckiaceae bacterium]
MRPLPKLQETAAAHAPVEPISIARGKRRLWRPVAAILFTMTLAVGGVFFLLDVMKRQLPRESDAPPVISAPVTPSTIPAPPPAEESAAQAPSPPASTPVNPTPPLPAFTNAQPVPPVPDPAQAFESAGILGEPQITPFDSIAPIRTVKTVSVPAEEAANYEAPKPFILTDPTTWPPGASLADPHPMPPRRR